MKNLVPTIFYQLHHKMNGEEAKDFFQFLKNENNTAIANQLNGLNPNEASVLERKNIVNDFAKKLFGNQRAGIEGFISQKNELRPDSSKALMTVANTLVIGHFSKLIRAEGLNLNTFKKLLDNQQQIIESALPAGISKWLGNIRPLATSDSSAASRKMATRTAAAAAAATRGSAVSDAAVAAESSSMGWAKWLLLLPLLFLGLWYFLGQGSLTNLSSNIADAKPPVVNQSTTIEQTVEKVDELAQATKDFAEEVEEKSPIIETGTTNYNNVVANKKTEKKEEPSVKIYPPVEINELSLIHI